MKYHNKSMHAQDLYVRVHRFLRVHIKKLEILIFIDKVAPTYNFFRIICIRNLTVT